MNDPTPIDRLFRLARAHHAPPDLWPRIAARAHGRRARVLPAAALLAMGSLGYLLAAAALRPERPARRDGLVGIVAVALPYLGGAVALPPDAPLVLQRVAEELARRPR